MTSSHWALILVLALAAISIRIAGLLAGDRIRTSSHAWVLDELPGLIVVSLVAASLAGQPWQVWSAAALALVVAITTNHVLVTMCLGIIVFASLNMI
ncbi:AzlD domain-containing protein [Gymnodinialimonas sp. 2305UL16-5]|uniref:AzlD domain-containing protein n=1 Tax=Gymnodinialimonas mytili TaxID=3126503 RepID=UPI00309F3A6D